MKAPLGSLLQGLNARLRHSVINRTSAKAFYATTVGWTFEGMPMPDRDRTYWIAKAEGKPVAGILDMRGIVPDGDPPHWLSYLAVDDVDRRVAEIERNGGRIVRQPFDVPDFGRIAIGADATGAFMAWVTTKRRPAASTPEPPVKVSAPWPDICKTNFAACLIGAPLLAARFSRIAPSSGDGTWLDICVHRSRRAITLEAAN